MVFIWRMEGEQRAIARHFHSLLSVRQRATYALLDFALTPSGGDHSISPESSDGLASVGTILPRRKGRPVAGRLFRYFLQIWLGGSGLFPHHVVHPAASPDPAPQKASLCPRSLYDPPPQRYNRLRKADVAQLVEQPIRNRQVSGSTPLVGSSLLLCPIRPSFFANYDAYHIRYRVIHCFLW